MVGWGEERKVAVGEGKESPTDHSRQGDFGRGRRIATGAERPRDDRSRKNLRVIPRPVRRLVVGIRNTPAQRSRRTDCHSRCAHRLRNDTVNKGCGASPGGRTEASAPTEALQGVRCKSGPDNATPCRAGPVCPAGSAVRNRRADRGVRPYGSVTGGAMGGRPQGSPLRKSYKGCGKTGRCGHRPLRRAARNVWAGYRPRRKFF